MDFDNADKEILSQQGLTDSIDLFFLLKVRMEPMLALRSVVASLAKSGADLHHRASLKSEDEFSELARDLNHFLDRLCLILEDVGVVLEKIAALNLQFGQINIQIEDKYKIIQDLSRQVTHDILAGNTALPLLSREWKASMQLTLATIGNSTNKSDKLSAMQPQIDVIWQQFDETLNQLEMLGQNNIRVAKTFVEMNSELQDFNQYINDMSVLEERMQAIADQGQGLVHRLTVKEVDDLDQTAGK